MGPGASQRSGGTALCELRVTVAASRGDEVSAVLIRNGAGGVVEEAAAGGGVRLITYGERPMLERLAETVSSALVALPSRALVEMRAAPASLDGWETAWMKALEPVKISRSLTLVPTNAVPPKTGKASVVRLRPALAFGFGEHPTTRLAARAVEHRCRAGGVKTVLDVGTGTGVLAIVATVSGASRAVGIDVDPRAVRAAKQNAALNGVAGPCRFSTRALSRVRGNFDLVVANIDRGTILAQASALRRAVAPRGALLLTGFLSEDVPDIERPFLALGLLSGPRKREAGWALIALRASGTRRARRDDP
jgi:ribosomal protein L11 methyltransferase